MFDKKITRDVFMSNAETTRHPAASRYHFAVQEKSRPHDRQRLALVLEYHRRTELFDRSICRVMNERRIAVPQTGAEQIACEQNSNKVIEELLPQAEVLGMDRAAFMSAIHQEARLFEEKFARGEIDLKKPMI